MSTCQTPPIAARPAAPARGGRRQGRRKAHAGWVRPRAVDVVAILRSRIHSMEREYAILRQGVTQRDERIAAPEEARAYFEQSYTRLPRRAQKAHPPPKRTPGKRGRPKQSTAKHLRDRLLAHREETLALPRDVRLPL